MNLKVLYKRKFNQLSQEEKVQYSASKLGDIASIEVIAKNIISILPKNSSFDTLTSVPHQHVGFLKNPAEEEGLFISNSLKTLYIYMQRSLKKDQKQYFYYNEADRLKLNMQTIKASRSDFKDKNVLLIDDLSASGSILKASANKLIEAEVSNITVCVDILMDPKDYKEERALDVTLLTEHLNKKSDILLKIIAGIKSENTVITKRLLELLFASNLTNKDYLLLTSSLSVETAQTVLITAKEYFKTTKSTLSIDIDQLISTLL